MTERTAQSFNVDIHMAGSIVDAALIIQRYAADTGMCVTLSQQSFIYTGGREEGFRVGLINYPRFPKAPGDILALAHDLARNLRVQLGQQSYSIVTPLDTTWVSIREDGNPVNTELLAVAEMLAALKDVDGKRTPTNAELAAARAAVDKAKGISAPPLSSDRKGE